LQDFVKEKHKNVIRENNYKIKGLDIILDIIIILFLCSLPTLIIILITILDEMYQLKINVIETNLQLIGNNYIFIF